jgi:hypothetical protein
MNRLEAIILKEKGADGRSLTQLQIGAPDAAVALAGARVAGSEAPWQDPCAHCLSVSRASELIEPRDELDLT